MAIGFELSRLTQAYDYRTFCKQLLGRAWVIYEILFVALVLLILAVLGAASGELVSTHFGVPPVVGTITLMALIGLLVFWGTSVIEKALAGWSFLLYAVYAVLIFAYLSKFGHKLPAILAADDMSGPWVLSTIRLFADGDHHDPVLCPSHGKSARRLYCGCICRPYRHDPGDIVFAWHEHQLSGDPRGAGSC
jgi:uncharacterized membrane protein YkvI